MSAETPNEKSITIGKERWIKTAYFCCICGKQTMWMLDHRRTGGDVYDGPTYSCSACAGSFCWPMEPSRPEAYSAGVFESIEAQRAALAAAEQS